MIARGIVTHHQVAPLPVSRKLHAPEMQNGGQLDISSSVTRPSSVGCAAAASNPAPPGRAGFHPSDRADHDSRLVKAEAPGRLLVRLFHAYSTVSPTRDMWYCIPSAEREA